MSNVPAVRESGVPALASTPALAGIRPEAIALQKLYRGEFQSGLVQEGVVPAGCIYMASGPDDPEPQVLVKDATSEKADGVVVHVLKVSMGKSGHVDGDFRSFGYDDPTAPTTQDNGRPLDTTYNFVLALPEVDPDMPVKVTMSRTSSKTAQRIITRLMRHKGGQAYDLAFSLKLQKRESENNGSKYRWFVWREQLVDAKPENVDVAATLSAFVSAPEADVERTSTANQPRI